MSKDKYNNAGSDNRDKGGFSGTSEVLGYIDNMIAQSRDKTALGQFMDGLPFDQKLALAVLMMEAAAAPHAEGRTALLKEFYAGEMPSDEKVEEMKKVLQDAVATLPRSSVIEIEKYIKRRPKDAAPTPTS